MKSKKSNFLHFQEESFHTICPSSNNYTVKCEQRIDLFIKKNVTDFASQLKTFLNFNI